MGGGKLCVGLPETGTARPMSCLGYTVRADRKFYQAGGEQEGRDRRQYRTCEVRSLDLFRVGDLAEWEGKQLPVCAREVHMQAAIWNLPMYWRTEAGRGRDGLETRRSPECRFSEP